MKDPKKKGNFNRKNDDSPLKFGVPYLLTSPNMMISYYIPYILAEMSPIFVVKMHVDILPP